MARLATLAVAFVLGAALGVIGIFATLSAVNPSADHVAEQVTDDPAETVYGTP